MSKWAAPHPTTEQEAKRISEERRLLWIRLNEFCTERSGAITTKPFASPARLEVPPESELPKRLADAGYRIVFHSRELRVGGDGFVTRDVYSIPLPK